MKRLMLLGVLVAIPSVLPAEDPAGFFQQNCGACHSIGGGRLVGPDLQGVLQRKDRKWLLAFLDNPQAALDSDAYGKKILEESNGMVMPPVAGLDHAKAEALLDWIDAQSKPAGTQAPAAAAPAAAEAVFTPADIALGKEIVLGSRPLANGGSPCISCHTFRGLPWLGGGSLGPDLTQEYTRLGGRKGVTGWLTAPPTPTMQSVYKARPLNPDEIRSLAAYLESVSNTKEESASNGGQIFFLLGLGGCLIALVVMNIFWSKRFSAVRRPLVAGRKGQI
jgi:mono/diheme cytochrome c family protein